MKKTKIISLLLTIIIVFGIFAGCGNSDKYVFTSADGTKFPIEPYVFFSYWYRDTWATYYYQYTGTDDIKSHFDEKATDDQSLGDFIVSQSKDQCLYYTIISKKFDELGLKFTDEIQKSVDYSFEETFIKSYTEEQLNNIYKTLNLTKDQIKDILSVNFKDQMITEYYYGEGGEYEISEDTIKNSFLNDYARFKYIALSKTDSSGNSISTSDLMTKYNTANDIMSKLDGGASFEDMIAEYSEDYEKITDDMTEDEKKEAESLNEILTDSGLMTGKDGYIIQQFASTAMLESSIVNKLFTLKNNEYALIESDAAFWIIKRCDIAEYDSLYKDVKSVIFNDLIDEPYDELYEKWKNEFGATFNEKVIEKYNPKNLEPLFFVLPTTENTENQTEKQPAADTKRE